MSANGDERFTVEEAAEKLRSIKSSAGEDALREFFQTGGGLLDFEQDDLTAAVRVVGEQRAQQILGVDVPSELPGEQAALPGRERFPDEATERAEPSPRGAARLSDFGVDGDDEPEGEGPPGTLTCDSRQAALERLVATARGRGELDPREFNDIVDRSEVEGCISSADATRLRDIAQSAGGDPSPKQIDDLFDVINRAFAGGPGNR